MLSKDVPLSSKSFLAVKHREDLWLAAAGCCCFAAIYFGIITEKRVFFIAPFFALCIPVLVLIPKILPYCFIGSFFIEKNFFVFQHAYSCFFINLQDIFVFLLVAGYLTSILLSKSASPESLKPSGEFTVTILEKSLVLFFIASLISFVVNLSSYTLFDSLRNISYVAHLSELIIVFYLLHNMMTRRERDSLISFIILLSVFELLVVANQYRIQISQGLYFFRNISGLYGHHSQIGNMMTLSITCCAYKFLTSNEMRKRIIYLILSIFFCWAVIVSGSRSNLLGIICATAMFLISQIKFSKTYFLLLVGILVLSIGLMILSPLNHLIKETFRPPGTGVDLSSYQRFFIWKGAWEHFTKASILTKLFGIGIGNYSNLHYGFFLETGRTISGAHNNFLHVLSETGIVGVSAFFFVFLSIIRLLWKKRKENKLAFLLVWATIALLISGFTQETFWFQVSFGSFWLFYMIVLSFVFIDEPGQMAQMVPQEKVLEQPPIASAST